MKAADYCIQNIENAVSYDEHGNVYVDTLKITQVFDWGIFLPYEYLDDSTIFISKEDCIKYNQYEIINEDGISYDSDVRRPYYRMRGKPVTEEQAFDIIRRTDRFFCGIGEIRSQADFVGGGHSDNWMFSKNHYPNGYGWIHTDGTVGTNGITYKYPNLGEFLDEWLCKLRHFPYLDLVFVITDWDEIPNEVREVDYDCPLRSQRLFEYEDWDERFYKAVQLGIYVHDKTIEVLSSQKAISKYKEYAALYEKNREIYVPDYYMEHGIEQVNLIYLKRCIESYGLDADEVLGKEPVYTWKGKE